MHREPSLPPLTQVFLQTWNREGLVRAAECPALFSVSGKNWGTWSWLWTAFSPSPARPSPARPSPAQPREHICTQGPRSFPYIEMSTGVHLNPAGFLSALPKGIKRDIVTMPHTMKRQTYCRHARRRWYVHAQAGAHLIKGLNNSRGSDIKHIGEDSLALAWVFLFLFFLKA